MKIHELCANQREFFFGGKSRSIEFRRKSLHRLLNAIDRHEEKILAALSSDIGKSPSEGYFAEIAVVKREIRHLLRHVRRWSQPDRVATPLLHFPASSRIYHDPKGVVLILAPWNYPFSLLVAPLAAAIAAGNCALLKSSRFSPQTGEVVRTIVSEVFSPEYVACIDMTENSSDEILAERYDHIFFTGSEFAGKKVLAAAAPHLTPVTLELGGKSPCIVDSTADLGISAKRIVWGKFLNTGQTCVAPDFLLVQESVKEPLIAALKKTIEQFYGIEPLTNPDFPRIVNRRHFERLVHLLPGPIDSEKIVHGGQVAPDRLKMAPTILDHVTFSSRIMQEEIFGPILPVLTYQHIDDVIVTLQKRPSPLALYVFTKSRAVEGRVLGNLRYGGGCVNDTVVHHINPDLPFGGVGASGMGAYHGEAGFLTFTHRKSILKKGFVYDIPLRYPPYTERMLRFLRRFLG